MSYRHHNSACSLPGTLLVQTIGVLLLMVAALFPGTSAAFAQGEPATTGLVVTGAGRVHDLAPSLAASASVRLKATVSYYDPADGVLFVQDATGGVYIETDKDYPIKSGDLVEITGRPSSSYRTEVALDPDIRVLGRGQTFIVDS